MPSSHSEWPNSIAWEAPPYANIYVGVPILVIGIFGIIVNIYNVSIFCHGNSYHTSYGYLCIARASCNIVNLLLFAVYAGPDAIFQLLPDKDNIGRILGLIAEAGYATIPILQLGTACNRVVAIFIPIRYNKICTKKWAVIVICIGLTYGIAVTIDDIIEGCLFVYERSEFSWVYVNCSVMIQNYKLVYPLLIISVLTLFTNLFTAAKLFTEKFGNRRSSRKNTKLFWQSFAQEMFFANDLVWHNYLSGLVDSFLWLFFARTLMWELSHTLDGVILLAFDSRLRRPLISLIQTRSFSMVEDNIIINRQLRSRS